MKHPASHFEKKSRQCLVITLATINLFLLSFFRLLFDFAVSYFYKKKIVLSDENTEEEVVAEKLKKRFDKILNFFSLSSISSDFYSGSNGFGKIKVPLCLPKTENSQNLSQVKWEAWK